MLDADRIYHEVTTAGETWADTKSAFEALDDLTKTVLAEITSNFLPPMCHTKAEAEIRAQSSTQYKEHLATKAAARKAWLLAEVKYKGLVMLAELRRTQESTRRQEMKL
jgi:hypothetical protein